MLRKLFKHDMRQISKIMLPFMLLVLGTTVLGTAALKFAREMQYVFDNSIVQDLLSISLYFIFGFSVFVLFAYTVLSTFLSVSRYYKNLFTDEGYLTFTLPVNSSTLIFSKLWSTLIWVLVSVVVVIACILIYITFGGAPIGEFVNVNFYEMLGNFVWPRLKWFFSDLDVSSAFIIGEVVALELVSIVYGILTLFLAITIGSIMVRKHKILASIGFYYLINTAVSTVSTVFMTMFSFVTVRMSTFDTAYEAESFIHIYLVSMLLIYTIVMVAEFLITNHFLEKKLNLQ